MSGFFSSLAKWFRAKPSGGAQDPAISPTRLSAALRQSAPPPWSLGARVLGDDRPTLVSRTAYERAGEPKEAWRLVLDVVDHVNALREGLFHVDEIPRRAWGVYFADYYLAQVRNGGHSQYIHNARDLAAMSRSALDALDEMGAEALAAILREMLDWARAHPEEAGRQNGFEVRAPALDALDARFYAVNDGAPMSVASARWIAGWPDLKVIEDAELAAARAALIAASPHVAGRRDGAVVVRIHGQIADPAFGALGLTLMRCALPEARAWNGDGHFEADAPDALRLRTLTQVGLRRFELGPRHAVLHELFDGNPPTPIEGRDPDAYTRAFRRAQKLFKATPRVEVVLGRELARVDRREADELARRDDLLAIAGGIALALKRAGRDGLAATITFGSRPGTTCDFLCLALIGDSVETLMIDAGGRTRLMRDHELVVEVGAREAADFARVSLEAR